jgi:hypothetical protein
VKKQYEKYEYDSRWRYEGAWCYLTAWGYGRAIETFQHCRQYVHDKHDARHDRWAFKTRAKRNASFMNSWNIEPPVSRCGGKSWKDYTKNSKQWEKK